MAMTKAAYVFSLSYLSKGIAAIGRVGALVLACLTLTACAFFDDPTPDYRYRLTVEVETPEGLKTGSSVIEVEQWFGPAGGSLRPTATKRRARGEAVAVDLPGGQTLFALLRSESDIEWAQTVVARLAPELPEGERRGRLDNVLYLDGKVEVPRTYPAYAWFPERSAYPMMVTFADINHPTSVMRVDPDDLAASFGEGVKLKRITVELTDDRVTTGIEKRLPWKDAYLDNWFDGTSTVSEDLTTDELTAHVSSRSFSTELKR
jgi:hypothetical protein